MLAPGDRSLLLEALRPPVGYRLGRALATTYTLDLMALLTAPLAFTYYDWETADGRPSADPLALLEAVRRQAERLHVFCHGGAIHVPRDGQPLFAQLERCVIEVAAPQGGVFHPKVWVLRYEPVDDGGEEPVLFRLLVGTRNLTFDRSWDTLLRLDGELIERKRAFRENKPLARFVESLPGLAVGEAPEEAKRAAEELAEQVRRVKWELPQGVDSLEFLPLGLDGPSWPFEGRHGRMVMAPFVDGWFLKRFGAEREDGIVVSQAEELQEACGGDAEADCLAPYEEWRVLSSEVEAEQGVDDGEDDEDEAALEGGLAGLHAKLFVVDDGWRGWVWTGSANGTRAAFERNVEFLVGIDGAKSQWGVEAFLQRDERGGLSDLLEDWLPTEVEIDEEEQIRRELERACERVRDQVAAAELELQVVGEGEDRRLELVGELAAIEDDVRLSAWPVVLPASHAQGVDDLDRSPLASWAVSLEAATAFLAFECRARRSGVEHVLRFARRLPIHGLPVDREQRLLRSLLGDRDRVLRLLHLLLSAEQVSVERLTQALGGGEQVGLGDGGGFLGLPLFEAMLTALSRNRRALEPVERLVEDLSRTDEGRALLPEGFEALWAALSEAREATSS